MRNKIVLITGATKNSGFATARKFAAEGYSVCITSRDESRAQAAAEAVAKEFGVAVKGYGLDLSSPEEVCRVFADVKDTFGGLDVFVGNSANLGMGQKFPEISEEEFDDVIDMNIKGNFFCAQEAAKIMIEQHSGSIVFIGSVHSKAAVWNRVCYALTKGALATLTKNLAFELGGYGIRVNQVVPGHVKTDRWNGISDEEIARRRANWPIGLESTGEDIANAVYFMASEQAKTITGTELVVDSGVLTCMLAYNGGKH